MNNTKGDRDNSEALTNMHKMFLEALRHREQEIIHFLAILAPALGAFIWLITQWTNNPLAFVIGTYGVLFALFVGAMYSLALGYNYRYLTLQLAKLEAPVGLGLRDTILSFWPRDPQAFINANRWGVIPWSTPPGIIKVFWIAFLAAIAGVSVAAWFVASFGSWSQTAAEPTLSRGFLGVGAVAFVVGLLWPMRIGRKMLTAARQEDSDEWEKPRNEDKREDRDAQRDD